MSNKHTRGFTFVEILIVMGVLAILFFITLVAINPVRQFNVASDTKRKSDISQIHKSLMQYFVDHHAFPTNEQWASLTCGTTLVPTPFNPYLSALPCDPDVTQKYYYEPLDDNCQPCTGSACTAFRVMGKLKNKEDKAITNAGCDPENGCGIVEPDGVVPNYGLSSGCNVRKVCFCHNLLDNPHTICTSHQGEINGHQNHIIAGTDALGDCNTVPTITLTPTPSLTPTTSPTPTVTPTLSPSPTPTPTPTPTLTPTPTQFIADPGCTDYTFDTYWGQRTAPQLPTYPNGWFTTGSGNGQFNYPIASALDADGNIYISDATNHRVQKLSSTGVYITKWGSQGNGPGQFNRPQGIHVSPNGYVYISDEDYPYNTYNRIQQFASDGTFIQMWGSFGTNPGQFNRPENLTTDSTGNIYVADTSNNRIQKFDANGNFITQWGSWGTNNDQFKLPRDIAVTSNNTVYVVDSQNHRIQAFDANGGFITTFGSQCETGQHMQLGVCSPNKFFYPDAIALDASNNLYILDRENNRVQKYDSDLNLVTMFGAYATDPGQVGNFRSPSDLSVDPSGNVIYVNDYNRHNIQIFRCAN